MLEHGQKEDSTAGE